MNTEPLSAVNLMRLTMRMTLSWKRFKKFNGITKNFCDEIE